MIRKSPRAIRDEARRRAIDFAREREACGDPEGAEVIRDLARSISRIMLVRRDRR